MRLPKGTGSCIAVEAEPRCTFTMDHSSVVLDVHRRAKNRGIRGGAVIFYGYKRCHRGS